MAEKREHWASRIGFVMAAAGSAVGLGNVWKFPYITGVYGGAAFILVYLLCILLLGLPIMIAEFVIGRHTGKNPVGAFKKMAGKSPWVATGYLGIITGFLILSYYSVVGGWTMAYITKSVAGYLTFISSTESAAGVFSQFASNPWATVGYHFLFMAATMIIVIRGIKSGIERWNNILMPMIFLILIILIVKGLSMDNAKLGLAFLFKPDFSKLTVQAVIVALGQSFFTLSLGMGCMITYGSYLDKKEKILGAAGYVVLIDTLVAVFSGIAIFTAVFALGMKPDKGPALIFNVIPAVFAQIPFGSFFSTIFFILLFIAALTSSISLLEVVVAYFIDEKKWSAPQGGIYLGNCHLSAGNSLCAFNQRFKKRNISGQNVF